MKTLLQTIGCVIRECEMTDVDAVSRIDRSHLEGGWHPSDFCEFIARDRAVCTVIERNGVVLGFCCYYEFPSRIVVDRIAVADGGRGHGKMLMHDLKRKMLKSEAAFIDFIVSEDNTKAHLFLQAVGFKAVDVDTYDGKTTYHFRLLRGE